MEAPNIPASERVENAWDDGLNSSPQGLTTNLKYVVETDFSNKIVYRYQHCGEYFCIVLLFSPQPGEFLRVVPNALVYSRSLVRLDGGT